MKVVDSHTEGEPTRLILDGGPDLGSGTVAEQRQRFADEFDAVRRTAILEPRGSDILVGAMLCSTPEPDCATGVIFFNNVGFLGMCGHGTIGVVVSLAHLGRLTVGRHRIDTPVGVVAVTLEDPNTVVIENVPSYRHRESVEVEVPELGTVRGDIAWGGNWFFLVSESPHELILDHASLLTEKAQRIKDALRDQGITGADGGEIDHVEFFGPPVAADANSRNFVLCPGNAYDRSPCGTGTSAKLACLAASAALKPGEPWIQESIIGSRFEGSYQISPSGEIIPRIKGSAYVYSEAKLLQHPEDPFREGIS